MNRHSSKKLALLLLFLCLLLLPACYAADLPLFVPFSQGEATSEATPAQGGEPIQIYFTQPDGAGSRTNGPDQKLVEAIQKAQKSVDMAMYNLNLENVGAALLAAQKRGVKVRLVMESESMDNKLPTQLISGGIPITGDEKDGLMHNKFTVIDAKEVWTGSLNLTTTNTYQDNNNLVRIQSEKLAANYLNEFNKMFTNKQFGSSKKSNTPNPVVNINGKRLEVYFSPADHTLNHLLPVIKNAKKSIDFLALSYTSDDLRQVMLDRAKAGVKVRGVFDADQAASNKGTEYETLKSAQLDIRKDGNKGLMHHKVIIVDQQIVIFGSYNFSYSADEVNDENLLILSDPESAARFTNEFERVYQKAKP